jgi:carnitine-CoA ligase
VNHPYEIRDVTLRPELILPLLLLARAEETPNFTFAHEVDGRTATYAQMNDAALSFGSYFASIGIDEDEIVATFLFSNLQALEVWLGLAWVGAAEAALNTGYRHQLLADVVNDTQAATIVTTASFLPVLNEVAGSLNHVQRVVLLDVAEVGVLQIGGWTLLPATEASTFPHALEKLREPTLESTSCILYTSGTTGPSKGVIIPWAQMLETGRTIVPVEHMTRDDIMYCPYAPCHITGKAYFYSMLLLGGGYVVKGKFRTEEFWRDIHRFGCTTTLLQGAMAHFLLNQPPVAEERDNPLTHVIVAPVIAEVVELERRFGLRVGTAYNMTELSCPLVSDGWYNDGPGGCGTPRPRVSVRLVDSMDHEVVVGEVGELVVRNDDPWTLTTGYLRRPEATVQATRNLWFHTGDAMYRDGEGRYFFVDRIKDSIRRRGENISSAEIEREVRPFGNVKECAAVAAPSEFGEDDVRIMVVAEPGRVVIPAELYSFLSLRLAAYMLPRYIDIVDQIPKTETQKVQKNLLRALPIGETTWVAPQSRPRADTW